MQIVVVLFLQVYICLWDFCFHPNTVEVNGIEFVLVSFLLTSNLLRWRQISQHRQIKLYFFPWLLEVRDGWIISGRFQGAERCLRGKFFQQWKKKKKKLLGIFHHIAIVKCYLCKKYLEVFWDIEHVVQVDQGCLKSFKGSERGTLEQEILGTSPIY